MFMYIWFEWVQIEVVRMRANGATGAIVPCRSLWLIRSSLFDYFWI